MEHFNRFFRFFRLSLLFVALFALALSTLPAQTVTPNTTLCAAVTSTTQTSVCLASTTSIVNQTVLYVDQEPMTVLLANYQTLPAGPTQVPVSRGNRAAGSGPALHANGAVVWIGYTPSQSVVPGANGFNLGTQFGDVGPCTRGNMTYLPHIWPNRGVMRDCSNGFWVDFTPMGLGQNPSPTPLVAITASGALTAATGNLIITKSSAAAVLTLGAPGSTYQDGAIITITSSTAQAHTITATGLFLDGSTTTDVATFAAHGGATLTIMAYQGKWVVLSANAITFS